MLYYFYFSAAYGKFEGNTIGFRLNAKFSWMIMEVCPVIWTIIFVYRNFDPKNPIHIFRLFSFAPYFVHYVHRALIYPQNLFHPKPFPFAATVCGMVFTTLNTVMLISSIFLKTPMTFLMDKVYTSIFTHNFISFSCMVYVIGLFMFIIGMYINIKSDYRLISLRKAAPENVQYVIPHGFPFDTLNISCPNYAGECFEWLGFAVMTGSIGAAVFAFSSVAVIGGRSLQQHKWYKNKFGVDYPKKRKAFVPLFI